MDEVAPQYIHLLRLANVCAYIFFHLPFASHVPFHLSSRSVATSDDGDGEWISRPPIAANRGWNWSSPSVLLLCPISLIFPHVTQAAGVTRRAPTSWSEANKALRANPRPLKVDKLWNECSRLTDRQAGGQTDRDRDRSMAVARRWPHSFLKRRSWELRKRPNTACEDMTTTTGTTATIEQRWKMMARPRSTEESEREDEKGRL